MRRVAVQAHRDRTRVRIGAWAGAMAMVTLAVAGCGRPDFVPYAPTADLVPAIGDESGIHLGSPGFPTTRADCDADDLRTTGRPGPNGSEWRAVSQVDYEPEEQTRIVWFATERFGSGGELDQRMDVTREWFAEPCFDEDDPSVVEMEPAELDGLPAGAVTAHWPVRDNDTWSSDDAWSTVIADRDRRIIMTVVWAEGPGEVPTDTFVEVVNTAWTRFQEDNS